MEKRTKLPTGSYNAASGAQLAPMVLNELRKQAAEIREFKVTTSSRLSR
jgi:hypothetical protein